MEKCVSCGREFEPLPLPESPELFGIKAPHKVISPACGLEGAAATLAGAVLEATVKEPGKKLF